MSRISIIIVYIPSPLFPIRIDLLAERTHSRVSFGGDSGCLEGYLFVWVDIFSAAWTATGNSEVAGVNGFPAAEFPEFSVFPTILGFGVIGSSLGLEGTEPSILDVTDG